MNHLLHQEPAIRRITNNGIRKNDRMASDFKRITIQMPAHMVEQIDDLVKITASRGRADLIQNSLRLVEGLIIEKKQGFTPVLKSEKDGAVYRSGVFNTLLSRIQINNQKEASG